ncbi:Mucin-5AC [Pteropus alecto]|uniref:Mucin-5AC n=1 Tax=Pteropus alecto TaxID=9402 RepID=L5KN91_PTEAL|nr:Mucin-5AC [Pteropus alecto]
MQVTEGWGSRVPPLQPGHTVNIDCQECTCDGSTQTMRCQTQPCPLPPACPEPGFVPVPAAPQAGQCCPQYSCACNTSYCPAPVDCPEGSRQLLDYEKGTCCPSWECRWTICSVNGTTYQPGAVVFSSPCETCTCQVPSGPQFSTFVISCETQTCNTYCPVGFEYQALGGQCCGHCVQVACVTNGSDGSVHLFYPGESWSDPGNRCVTHECEKHRDGLVVVTTTKACPPLNCPAEPLSCVRWSRLSELSLVSPAPRSWVAVPARMAPPLLAQEQAQLSEDGCCRLCTQPHSRFDCTVHHKQQVVHVGNCSSTEPVLLAYCQGHCGDSTSMYSLEANAVEHRCRCCQGLRTLPRNVTLVCTDGSSRAFSYGQVEECGCVGLQCDPPGGLGFPQSQDAGRWSRGALLPGA